MTNGARLITTAELLAEAEREEREFPWLAEREESEYRRGYCDGFIEAVNAMANLFARGLSKQAVYDRLYDHWEGDLFLVAARRLPRGGAAAGGAGEGMTACPACGQPLRRGDARDEGYPWLGAHRLRRRATSGGLND